jgi:hypothetical protein
LPRRQLKYLQLLIAGKIPGAQHDETARMKGKINDKTNSHDIQDGERKGLWQRTV